MKTRFLPFIVRGTDDPGGGVIDDPVADPVVDPAPDPVEDPQFDLRTKEQEEREQRIYAQAQADLLAKQQAEQAQAQRQQTGQDAYEAKLQEIADIQYTDPVKAERLRMELAEERAEARVRSQYGSAIQTAGITGAVEDVDVKFADAPEEVRPYLKAAVRELGLQNEIPAQFIQAVKDMGFGKAVQAGAIGKSTKKTVAATGAESTTFTNASVPADLAQDAAAFEAAFGAAAKNNALKEIGYA